MEPLTLAELREAESEAEHLVSLVDRPGRNDRTRFTPILRAVRELIRLRDAAVVGERYLRELEDYASEDPDLARDVRAAIEGLQAQLSGVQ